MLNLARPRAKAIKTLSLCHFEGAIGQTSFIDEVPGRVWTREGSSPQAQIDTSEKKWQNSSLRFPATTTPENLKCTIPDFSAGNFTIEAWVRLNGAGNPIINSRVGTAAAIHFNIRRDTGSLYFEIYNSFPTSVGVASVSGLTINAATWYHIAAVFTFSSKLMEVMFNGNRVASATASAGPTTGIDNVAPINPWVSGTESHMDDFRLSNVVRHTGATYAIPTGPFELD